MRGVLDTSVFIAQEQERDLAVERLPDEAAVSIVTLAELQLGVHLARSARDAALFTQDGDFDAIRDVEVVRV